MSAIKEALAKLDPANENHWTSDGLPRIEAVRLLAADQSITRDMITAESPGFKRDGVAPVVAPVEPTVAPVVEKSNFPELIQAARDELARYQVALNEVTEAFAQKQAELDALISEEQASGAAESNDEAIQGYLKSQQGLLAERARRAQVLRDSGVTLADIQNLIPQASALDQSLAKKKR